MAHEITETDNVVLHKRKAWHGMGILVDKAPTPREALTLAGLDWDVQQKHLVAIPDATRLKELIATGDAAAVYEGFREAMNVDSHVLNVRSDNQEQLGVVTSGYVPIDNATLADFCAALAEGEDAVTIETAGSVKGGKRVWFLLKGESFSVRHEDAITPYILASNGHDGGAALRFTPTTIRTVCSNTLHAVIPKWEREGVCKVQPLSFATRHTTHITERLEEAKRALGLYHRAIAETRNVIDEMARQEVVQSQLVEYFRTNYERDFNEIPSNPTDKKEERRRDKANSAMASFMRRFDDDTQIAGTTAWNAFNSYSGLIQHGMKARGRSDEDRITRRVESNLFGLNAQRTHAAFAQALMLSA